MAETSDAITLERICVRLRADDLEVIRELAASGASLGLNGLIREILHSYVVRMRAAERDAIDKITTR